MQDKHEAWLSRTNEAALEPELPICDAHHHLWQHTNDRYLAADLLRDMSGGHQIVNTVSIEAWPLYQIFGPKEMTPVGETEFIINDTAKTDSPTKIAAAIVGYADLAQGGEVARVLESQIAASQGRFRGIRFITAWDASPVFKRPPNPKGLMYDDKFRQGFATLNKYGLTFDALVFFHQLFELADLAKAFPETKIIVSHIGGLYRTGPYADKQEQVVEEWQRGMAGLAQCSNVFMKLGGFGMAEYGFGWHEMANPAGSADIAETIAPYYRFCLDKFGADRCLFESNFPVDKESFSYTTIWNAFKRLSSDLHREERRALFYDNAARLYRL